MSVALVGLTGGIGSGKSTAAAMFAELGVPVLDLDEVGHRVVVEGDCLRALVQAFGERILDGDGRLDRARLARIAFASDENVRRLNAITHPRIWREMEAWLRGLGDDVTYALIEASVLIESGGASRMDAVVVVLASESTRRRRVREARGWPAARVDAVMARQCTDEARRQVADFVLENDGSLEALRRRVRQVHDSLLARLAPHPSRGAIDKAARGG